MPYFVSFTEYVVFTSEHTGYEDGTKEDTQVYPVLRVVAEAWRLRALNAFLKEGETVRLIKEIRYELQCSLVVAKHIFDMLKTPMMFRSVT